MTIKINNATATRMLKASRNMKATVYVTECKPLKKDRYYIANGKRAMVVPRDYVLAACSLRDRTVKLTMPVTFAVEFV